MYIFRENEFIIMINITYEKIYFNQYETISRLSMPNGEIRFLKFTLFKEDNRDLPEYGVCKNL